MAVAKGTHNPPNVGRNGFGKLPDRASFFFPTTQCPTGELFHDGFANGCRLGRVIVHGLIGERNTVTSRRV